MRVGQLGDTILESKGRCSMRGRLARVEGPARRAATRAGNAKGIERQGNTEDVGIPDEARPGSQRGTEYRSRGGGAIPDIEGLREAAGCNEARAHIGVSRRTLYRWKATVPVVFLWSAIAANDQASLTTRSSCVPI